jgi:hypothetical protein
VLLTHKATQPGHADGAQQLFGIGITHRRRFRFYKTKHRPGVGPSLQ